MWTQKDGFLLLPRGQSAPGISDKGLESYIQTKARMGELKNSDPALREEFHEVKR